ncbi:hypothetical protein B0H10DRAFT_1956153 [Mycena sp. CBHHK59/15]|nr:hypothetical protein B0H10DRAFT_1956153 [Mycena sp. CBHHK59/15]
MEQGPRQVKRGDAAIADIADAGYTTTVGVGSFREVLSNKINPEHALKTCLRPGRPKTIHTGMRGKPRKTATRKVLEKKIKKPRKIEVRDANKENTRVRRAIRRKGASSATPPVFSKAPAVQDAQPNAAVKLQPMMSCNGSDDKRQMSGR